MKGRHLLSSFLKHSQVILILCCCFGLRAQTIELVVLDENNIVLTGVEVYNNDFTITGITDQDGNVQLPVSDENTIINFSYLGYETLQRSVADLRELDFHIQLQPAILSIEEVLVIGRSELSKVYLPYQVESISAAKLKSTHSQTAADALADHGGLFVQKSQMGGGSPVIRGFEANKVLLVVDGIRMNNAIYRNGHLQNAVTIDQAMLERLEVIYGPNSLMYGSDALGGVVHFKSRDPELNYDTEQSTKMIGNYFLRHSTANGEKTGHIDLNYGKDNWGSLTSLSYSSYGDQRAGANRDEKYPDFGLRPTYVDVSENQDLIVTNDNPNVQVGTGYGQLDLLQKFLYQPSEDVQFVANFQYSTSTDVPRYDRLTETRDGELRFAEWYYGPQNRFLGALTAKNFMATSWYDRMISTISYQFIEEDRIERSLGNTTRSHQEENVGVLGLTIDFEKSLDKRTGFYYGVDLQHNDVHSEAFDEDVNNGSINRNVLTRYPSDGSQMTGYGVYLQFRRSDAKDMGHFSSGIRYTGHRLHIRYSDQDPISWPNNFVDGITSTNSAVSWSLGYTQSYDNGLQWQVMSSSAFRSPNIDDLAKIRVKVDEITFPNPNITPEKSINGELTLGKSIRAENKKELAKFSVTGFYTRLKDAIVRESFTDLSGSTTFIDGTDVYNIVGNVNAQRANIYGISTNLKVAAGENILLAGSLNWTRGRIIEDGEADRPLSHIPPLYGKIQGTFKKGPWSIIANSRFNGNKPVEEYGDSTDNLEQATVDGTPSWITFNAYLTYDLSDRLSLSAALENLMDVHYRPFASGVSAAGRNAILSLRGNF